MLRLRRNKRSSSSPSPEIKEAQEAVRKVKAREKKVQASTSEIMSVVRELRDFQRRNNFVTAIRHALGGEGG
jgi:ferritin